MDNDTTKSSHSLPTPFPLSLGPVKFVSNSSQGTNTKKGISFLIKKPEKEKKENTEILTLSSH